jgi:hypothetical protein
VIEPWLDGRGVEVRWKGETHRVLLDVEEGEVGADGLEARTSCLVLKSMGKDGKDGFELQLPAGGKASFGGQALEGRGPSGLVIREGRPQRIEGKDLMPEAR